MYTRNFHAFDVQATGQRATTTINTSTGGALPVDSSGGKPRFVRFAATGTCYVRIGIGAQTAVTTDILVQAGAPVILAVAGSTNWAGIDDGTSVKITVTPLENS